MPILHSYGQIVGQTKLWMSSSSNVVLPTPKIFRTETSPSDAVSSHTQNIIFRVGWSYLSAEDTIGVLQALPTEHPVSKFK